MQKWIKKYSVETHTDWIVSYTYPKNDFRKDFVCQHSSRNKSRSSSRLRNRNFNCQATLVVKIRKITKDTKKKDLLIREDFNTSIKIVSHHDHAIHVAEAYSFLRINDDVKTTFIEYFNQGLTPAAAKIYHELVYWPQYQKKMML